MSNQNTNFVVNSVTVTDAGKKQVRLTYLKNAAPASGDVVEVDGQGTAVISYASGVSGWTVCGCKLNGSQPRDMNIINGTQGGQPALVVVDYATNSGTETLNFFLLVKDAQGTIYTSQDPAVTNEPD